MGVTFIAKEGTYTAPAKLTTKSITENGTYSANGDNANGYSSVTVNVPLPTGKITITENGTDIDIAQYASADVNVESEPSDFSTATVIIDTTQVNSNNYNILPSVGIDSITARFIPTNAAAETWTVPLYKGSCHLTITDWDVVATGDIEAEGGEGDWDVYINGDGTLTFTPA